MDLPFTFPYQPDPAYKKKVAYFCMEYGIHQPLKTYAGGLGFLAGSHMRSAFELKQPIVGIGILWKYGYYDQVRKQDQTMDVLFQEKVYGFLEKTDIRITIKVSGHDVIITAFYLRPEIFKTAPVFFLSTDIPENDYLAKTICHHLYDSNPETRAAAGILLGEGGAKLLEKLNWIPDIYHLNESHGLPLAFHLYKHLQSVEEVKKRLVFTNHTPEPGGNEKTHITLLEKLGYFHGIAPEEIRQITSMDDTVLDHTLSALRLAGKANGVSKMHRQTLYRTWAQYGNTCEIIPITNAQHSGYWADRRMYEALESDDDERLLARKKEAKRELFEEVADQNGEIYDEQIFTLVFAKRFGGYKRPELLLYDLNRFQRLISNTEFPVQVIWAGKPYPMDYAAIATFDKIVNLCKIYPNCSTLIGYEMKLSKLLKAGSDAWLNVPRMGHEASGTSGMAATMNGSINISMPDGWVPEFGRDGINCFLLPATDAALPDHEQDEMDATHLYETLEQVVLPMFYNDPSQWLRIMKTAMRDIMPAFDSKRMAEQYFTDLYNDI